MAAKKKQKKMMVHKHADKGPDYVVQVSDPKMLRKDVLEGLREVIIFMQGYDTFRKVQEEKLVLFNQLKSDVRDINNLVETKLKHYLPKGKIQGMAKPEVKKEVRAADVRRPVVVASSVMTKPAPVAVVPRADVSADIPTGELAELEAQLKEIEDQLQNIK